MMRKGHPSGVLFFCISRRRRGSIMVIKMPKIHSGFTNEVKDILRRNGVGVVPTDTIYGISAPALSEQAVMRIYKIRERDLKKPMIILISSLADLSKFGIRPAGITRKILKDNWPARKFFYLHRGTKALAFRMPKNAKLRDLIREVGPLVSTSVNYEGKPPAKNIGEARKYFGDRMDFYVDAGELDSAPSPLIAVKRGQISVLRQGAVELRA